MKRSVLIILSLLFALGLVASTSFADDPPTTKKAGQLVFKLKTGDGKKKGFVAGPNEGMACATENVSTASSTHNDVEMECTGSDGKKATCICTLQCTNTCENYKMTTDCTANNCKAKGVDGNANFQSVQTEF